MRDERPTAQIPNPSTLVRGSIWIACILLCSVLIIYAVNFFGRSLSGDPEAWGQFGDFLGGTLNPLLGFLTLAAVLYTVRLQHELLVAARQQVEITSTELVKSSDALSQQVESSKRAEFRGTFFSLIGLQQQILGGLRIGEREGRDVFERYYGTLKGWHKNWNGVANYRDSMSSPAGLSKYEEMVTLQTYREQFEERCMEVPERAVWAYGAMYEQYGSDLGHYFRNLFNLIKFVDQSDLTMREKRTYCNFVRAQLSTYELVLLFYNCLTPYGFQKFFPLIERYGLIKHIDDHLLLQADHVSLYPIGARSGSPAKFADE